MLCGLLQYDMTNQSLDGDESLSMVVGQFSSPGENMGDFILPQLEERIDTLKESRRMPFYLFSLKLYRTGTVGR